MKQIHQVRKTALATLAIVIAISGCNSDGDSGDGSPAPAKESPNDTTDDRVPEEDTVPPAPDKPLDDCTENADPRFTADITDTRLLLSILPLGTVAGNEIKSHTYLKNVADMPDPRGVPIYAPADSELDKIAYYVSGEINEYLLIFRVSCQVTYRFDHVQIVVNKIKDITPKDPANDSRTSEVRPRIAFRAGELVGYTRGTPQARTWDFGVYNTTNTNQFVNNKRYENNGWTNYLNAGCPYDLFDTQQKTVYYALLGWHDGPIPNTTCRDASRDKASTIAGAWFLDAPADGPYGERIAVASEPNGEVRVAGLGASHIGDFRGVEPETVKTETCYSNGSRIAYLRLVSETRMDVYYKETETCPGSFPAEGYKTYAR